MRDQEATLEGKATRRGLLAAALGAVAVKAIPPAASVLEATGHTVALALESQKQRDSREKLRQALLDKNGLFVNLATKEAGAKLRGETVADDKGENIVYELKPGQIVPAAVEVEGISPDVHGGKGMWYAFNHPEDLTKPFNERRIVFSWTGNFKEQREQPVNIPQPTKLPSPIPGAKP